MCRGECGELGAGVKPSMHTSPCRLPTERVPTVHCVKRRRRHRWKWAQVTFSCTEEPLCQLWLQTLRNQLGKLSMCPWLGSARPGVAGCDLEQGRGCRVGAGRGPLSLCL